MTFTRIPFLGAVFSGGAGAMDAPAPALFSWRTRARSAATGRGASALLIAACLMVVFIVGRMHELSPATQRLPIGKVLLPIAALLLLARRDVKARLRALRTPQMLGLAVFFAAMALSVPRSISPSDARSSFLALGMSLLPFAVLLAAAIRDEHEFAWIARTYVLSVVLLGALVALGAGGSEQGRAFASTSYDPNDVALVGVVSLPFSLWLLRSRHWQWRVLAGAGVMAVLVLLVKSASRGGMIGLVVVLAGSFLLNRRMVPPRWRLAGGALVIAALALAPSVFWTRLASIGSLGNDYNATESTGRIALWTRGVGYFEAHPLTGLGLDQYRTAEAEWIHDNYLDSEWKPQPHVAHNSFVQVAAELGIVGVIGFLGMLLPTLFQVRRVRRWARRGEIPDSMARLGEAVALALTGFLVCAFFLSMSYSAVALFLVAVGSAYWAMVRRARSAGAA